VDSLRKGDEVFCGDMKGFFSKASVSMDSQVSDISSPVGIGPQACCVEKTEKQETVDDADVAVVEPSESKGKCTEREFDATLKKCDDENVAVDHFGSDSNEGGLEPESVANVARARNIFCT